VCTGQESSVNIYSSARGTGGGMRNRGEHLGDTRLKHRIQQVTREEEEGGRGARMRRGQGGGAAMRGRDCGEGSGGGVEGRGLGGGSGWSR